MPAGNDYERRTWGQLRHPQTRLGAKRAAAPAIDSLKPVLNLGPAAPMMVGGKAGTLAFRWPILDPGGASIGRGETAIVEAIGSPGEVKRL